MILSGNSFVGSCYPNHVHRQKVFLLSHVRGHSVKTNVDSLIACGMHQSKCTRKNKKSYERLSSEALILENFKSLLPDSQNSFIVQRLDDPNFIFDGIMI